MSKRQVSPPSSSLVWVGAGKEAARPRAVSLRERCAGPWCHLILPQGLRKGFPEEVIFENAWYLPKTGKSRKAFLSEGISRPKTGRHSPGVLLMAGQCGRRQGESCSHRLHWARAWARESGNPHGGHGILGGFSRRERTRWPPSLFSTSMSSSPPSLSFSPPPLLSLLLPPPSLLRLCSAPGQFHPGLGVL